MATPCPEVTADSLATTSLFRNVDLDFLIDRLSKCERRHLAPGETLLQEGMENRSLYVVLAGVLQARIRVNTDDEQATLTSELGAGDCVGEMSVIEESPATATVVAKQATWLLEIPRELIWTLVDHTTFVSRNLLYILAGRLRRGNLTLSAHHNEINRLHQLVHHDVLTGVQNRRWFDEQLELAVAQFHRTGEALSLIALDIDHFKQFNDRYGHAAGDLVLCAVATAIDTAAAEAADLARTGGEEFALILPACNRAQAGALAEQLRAAVEGLGALEYQGQSMAPVNISLGAAELQDGEPIASFMARTDGALYAAKASGRNRVCLAELPRV